MTGQKQRLRSRRALIVIAVWTVLILICRQNGVSDILSGQQRFEWIAGPAVKLFVTQVGSWQNALRDRLANARFLVPVRLIANPNPRDSEVRTLRLYHVHTRESLVVTYKRNGRYLPSAMAQLDHFFRDWRTNTVVSMSGETIDLLWQLHNELGSKQPINVISGFRSAQTNALLKRIGRQVVLASLVRSFHWPRVRGLASRHGDRRNRSLLFSPDLPRRRMGRSR
jgi:Bacterial protein of unknown function (DUF882)